MENTQRTNGVPVNYRFDRGGTPALFGPFYGKVMNNVDPTRNGRLQVDRKSTRLNSSH